jgi:acylpyruvate hydrolase
MAMKIFCIGKNYVAHVEEMNGTLPKAPVIFMKPPTAFLGNGKPFYLPSFSNNIHYEAELVLKVDRAGKAISKEQAPSFISGVSLGIDFTARDVQDECKANRHPWEVAKSFDFSAAVGDFVELSLDEIMSSRFESYKNGELVQEGDPNLMIFDIPTVISFLSERFTLQKGDLIFTGTPKGVGQVHKGDLLELYLNDKKLLTTDIK